MPSFSLIEICRHVSVFQPPGWLFQFSESFSSSPSWLGKNLCKNFLCRENPAPPPSPLLPGLRWSLISQTRGWDQFELVMRERGKPVSWKKKKRGGNCNEWQDCAAREHSSWMSFFSNWWMRMRKRREIHKAKEDLSFLSLMNRASRIRFGFTFSLESGPCLLSHSIFLPLHLHRKGDWCPSFSPLPPLGPTSLVEVFLVCMCGNSWVGWKEEVSMGRRRRKID